MAESNVHTSELNQDSLEGTTAAPVSDVESAAEEVEKEGENSSAAPTNDAEDGTAAEDAQVAEESAEVEAAAVQGDEEVSNPEAEVHQNGNAEADSTEVDGAAEKRKSLSEGDEISAKKARVEEDEASAEVVATNGEDATA